MKPSRRTAWFLIFALISSPGLKAEPAGEPAPEAARPQLSLANLSVPETLGKVQTRFRGKTERWVIQIQDIHAHLTAQENISAILDHVAAVYGLQTVALEGGWSTTTFPESWGLPVSREKQMLARALLEDDQITGPAYSALFSPMPLKLTGIEDQALYEKNRDAYLEHEKGRAETGAAIEAWGKKITAAKQTTFNPDLLRFDAALAAFREGGKDAAQFLPALMSTIQARSVAIDDLDQMVLFRQILEKEKDIDKEKIESEADRLVKAFKEKNLHYEELLRSGFVPAGRLELYPESVKYLELLKLQDKLEHLVFFGQIEQAIVRVKEKLFASDDERALDLRSERFRLAKRILTLQATPDDLKTFETSQDAVASEIAKAKLDPALKTAIAFYDIAKQRDEVFFRRITEDPKLAGDIAVVTGGFHTDGLSARLQKAGISTIVVSPDLGGEAPNEEVYMKRMQDVVAGQTLSDMQNRFFLEAFDKGFVAGVAVLKETKNILKAVETVAQAVEGRQTLAPVREGPLPKGVSVADFMARPAARQKKAVALWLEKAQKSGAGIVLVAKTSVLKELLGDPVGLTLWKTNIAPQRTNTVGEIKDTDEYLDALIGTSARVVRIPAAEAADVDALADKHFRDAKQKGRIAVIDPEIQSSRLLILPVSPASILLARVMIEQGLSGKLEPEFLATVENLLKDIFTEQGVLETAA